MSTAAPVCRGCLRSLTSPATRRTLFQTRQPPKSISRAISTIPSQRLSFEPSYQRRFATSTGSPAREVGGHEDATTSARAAVSMQDSSASLVEPYIAQAATEALFKECARQADYIVPQAFERSGKVPKNAAGEDVGEGIGWWYDHLGLTPTFNTWAQVTYLHMWIIVVRLRYFPESYATIWLQHFFDHFFFEAEHRMNIFHGMGSRAMRNRYLKEMYNQWRGVQGAYDEGLIRGDAVLGAAVWRNIFKASDDVDWRQVALVVSFMRRGLRALDKANDKTMIGGLVRFGTPQSESALVLKESPDMKKPFGKDDDAELQRIKDEGNEPQK